MQGYANIGEQTVLFSLEDNVLELHLDTASIIKHVDFFEDNMLLPKSGNYIIGADLMRNHKFVFCVSEIPDLSTFFSLQSVRVYGYIEYTHPGNSLHGLALHCKEFDYFYPVRKGYELSIQDGFKSANFKTVPYNNTTETFIFNLDKKQITCTFGVEAILKKFSQSPFVLKSRLWLEFDDLSSMDDLYKIYHTVWSFFCFITYRKNIRFETVLYGKNESGKMYSIGEFYLFSNFEEDEEEKVIKGIATFDLTKSQIHNLFSEICKEKLYLQHIPESKRNGKTITPARFVLITAAFEWNVREIYNIPVSKTQNTVREEILTALDKLSEEKGYNRRKRKKLEFFSNLIKSVDVNLSNKISYVLNDLDSILKPFIADLYRINGKTVEPYTQMAERIQTQRNNYAHGNIDKKMNPDVVLDIIILEWVNHAMVFKKMGYNDHEIKKLINMIFDRNFYIPDDEHQIEG